VRPPSSLIAKGFRGKRNSSLRRGHLLPVAPDGRPPPSPSREEDVDFWRALPSIPKGGGIPPREGASRKTRPFIIRGKTLFHLHSRI